MGISLFALTEKMQNEKAATITENTIYQTGCLNKYLNINSTGVVKSYKLYQELIDVTRMLQTADEKSDTAT